MSKHHIYHRGSKSITLKEGFSWPAFFFTFLWAFVKRQWRLGFILLGIAVVVEIIMLLICVPMFPDGIPGMFDAAISPAVKFFYIFNIIFALLFMFIIGKFANQWLAKSLRKKGYHQKRDL